ncbi:hypothetical protein [Actinoalloteichus spitiensis]|uniref:hypothetical protein n=1 Tax=Actinoalloteichus spitiensis TaxID=252394 RepID=UPI000372CD75|nr:hypothetical protein [Actinoalloteichus spitiensis]
MKLPTSISRLTTDDEWLTTVTTLLREVANDGFTFHLCGMPEPVVLVASYYWDSYVDLLKITGPDQVTAVRARSGARISTSSNRRPLFGRSATTQSLRCGLY